MRAHKTRPPGAINPFNTTEKVSKCTCFTAQALVKMALSGAVSPPPPLPLDQPTLIACLQYIQLVLKSPDGGEPNIYSTVATELGGAGAVTRGAPRNVARNPNSARKARPGAPPAAARSGRRLSSVLLRPPVPSPVTELVPSTPWYYTVLLAAPNVADTCQVVPPPQALPDTFYTPLGTTLTVASLRAITGNDVLTTPCATLLTVTRLVQNPVVAGATLTWAPDGTFTLQPPPTFVGTVVLDYTVRDCNGLTANSSVRVIINGTGPPSPSPSPTPGCPSPTTRAVSFYVPLDCSARSLSTCPPADVQDAVASAFQTTVRGMAGVTAYTLTRKSCTWIVSRSRAPPAARCLLLARRLAFVLLAPSLPDFCLCALPLLWPARGSTACCTPSFCCSSTHLLFHPSC